MCDRALAKLDAALHNDTTLRQIALMGPVTSMYEATHARSGVDCIVIHWSAGKAMPAHVFTHSAGGIPLHWCSGPVLADAHIPKTKTQQQG